MDTIIYGVSQYESLYWKQAARERKLLSDPQIWGSRKYWNATRYHADRTGAGGVEQQINPFWELKITGTKYQIVVTYKDCKTAIPLEKMDAFHSKLSCTHKQLYRHE